MKPQNLIKIFILILLFSLSNCVFLTENNLNQTVNDNSFLNRFPDNQKAILIFKFTGKSSLISSDKIYLCAQENLPNQAIDKCQSIIAANQYRILMLPPNIYYLLPPIKNAPIFPEYKNTKKEHFLTVLPVKAGEIIYAGDISLKLSDQGEKGEGKIVEDKNFIVKDNFILLQNLLSGKNSKQTERLFANQIWEINYLIKEYPTLQNRFKKQLLKSFPLEKPQPKSKPQLQNV
jgi:hypothetical protein